MNKEIPSNRSLSSSLLKAARREEWRYIDGELIPKLTLVDGNKMVKVLLKRVGNRNPNIRDLVATCLSHLNISDQRLILRAIDAMANMASSDQEVFPAGKAALFLFNQPVRDDETGVKIKQALKIFSRRVIEKDWEEQLREDISELASLLG